MEGKSTFFKQKLTLNIGDRLLDCSSPKVMGILNLTPDSFYDGEKNQTITKALQQCAKMLEEGASIIDIGAYSSRPGASAISYEEELQRLIPVLKAIVKEFPRARISIDTFRSTVAYQAIQEGAHMINDISAGKLDSVMFTTVAQLKVPYILMHMKGTPQTMGEHTQYKDLLFDICTYFGNKIKQLQKLGVIDLIIDPGFGFAKTLDQNYELLNKLDSLKTLGVPILTGLSRKSMIYKLLDNTPTEALNGTTAAHTIALLKGTNLLRVHDVKPAIEAIRIYKELVSTTQIGITQF